MERHDAQNFEKFLSQLLKTNANLEFYADFKKCLANVNKIAIKLNQLNYLIGKDNLEEAVRELWDENPKVFSVLNILIAARDASKEYVIDAEGSMKLLSDYFISVDSVVEFIHSTGLQKIFMERKITNLVDYVFGVEVGLDSNARKNRSGHLMEGIVALILRNNNITFEQQVKSEYLPEVAAALGDDRKRFDFVIHTKATVFLVEVNFYNKSGSKPNEVARAYMEIAQKLSSCDGYDFVWITDGEGWKKTRKVLEEAYSKIPHLFNLSTFRDFIKLLKANGQ